MCPIIAETERLGRVLIAGNTSVTHGGGIGSNGNVIIGTEEPRTELTVTKRWSPHGAPDPLPETVVIEVLHTIEGSGQPAGVVGTERVPIDTPTVIRNLPELVPDGRPYRYTVREQATDGYLGQVTGTADTGFTIENLAVRDVRVTKV